MSDAGDSSLTSSPVKSSGCTSDIKVNPNPLKIIKFSTQTRLASPIFMKEKHISNNYDSFLDENEEGESDFYNDEFGDSHRPVSIISNIYSQDCFSLSPEDVIFTELEFFSCKLKETTSKGGHILDAMEDEMTGGNSTDIQLEEANPQTENNSYKCVTHVITSDLPVYVLDFPMETNKAKSGPLDRGEAAPAVVSKLRNGDQVDIFCIKTMPNSSSSWLLLSSGWIPSNVSRPAVNTSLRLPREVTFHYSDREQEQGQEQGQRQGQRQGQGPTGEGDIIVLMECQYEALRCKGKGVPFRRQFKSVTRDFNPFSYDKSADSYTTVPM
jgi:hypothetical protein